jgi:hypothetical protein
MMNDLAHDVFRSRTLVMAGLAAVIRVFVPPGF